MEEWGTSMREQTICLLGEQEMITDPKDIMVLQRHRCLLPFPSSSSSPPLPFPSLLPFSFPLPPFLPSPPLFLLPLFSPPPLFILLVFALSNHTSAMPTMGGGGSWPVFDETACYSPPCSTSCCSHRSSWGSFGLWEGTKWWSTSVATQQGRDMAVEMGQCDGSVTLVVQSMGNVKGLYHCGWRPEELSSGFWVIDHLSLARLGLSFDFDAHRWA